MFDVLIEASIFGYVVINIVILAFLIANYITYKEEQKYNEMQKCENCKHCNQIICGKTNCALFSDNEISKPSYCKYWENKNGSKYNN